MHSAIAAFRGFSLASGYNRKPFRLDVGLPSKLQRGFVRGRRKVDSEEDKPAPVKIICLDGQALAEPRVAAVEGKHDIAFRLRAKAPASERAIAAGMKELGFAHSVSVCGFIADFFHAKLRIAVEIDGPCHKGRKAYDRQRDAAFWRKGIHTIRYGADDAFLRPEYILDCVRRAIAV